MKKTLVLISIIFLISCVNNGKNNRNKIDKLWIKHESKGYSVKYPNTWELVEDGRLGSVFMLYSPFDDSEDFYRENIIFSISDSFEPNFDLDKFVEISENPDITVFNNLNILSSKRIKGEKYNYHIMVFTGEKNNKRYKWKQYYWVIGEKIYVLSFNSKPDKYNYYINEVDSIMNSFSLIPEGL